MGGLNWTVLLLLSATICIDSTLGSCYNLDRPCIHGSFQRDPDTCSGFCHCAHTTWFQHTCPRGLYFDRKYMVCNWPDASPECLPPQGLCDINPCQNGGACQLTRMGYTCSCIQGFGGKNCLTRLDACADDPCRNGGTCIATAFNTAVCDCAPGFTGVGCKDTTCARYSCPDDVTSFNYPDWQDRSCRSYFSCQQGRLLNEVCSGDTVFSFSLLRCVLPVELVYPCTLNFVDGLQRII